MAIALMVTPPVAVRVEAEALVVRQCPETTAAVAATHCATEASSPGHLACLLLSAFFFLFSSKTPLFGMVLPAFRVCLHSLPLFQDSLIDIPTGLWLF